MIYFNGQKIETLSQLEIAIADLPDDQKQFIRNDFNGIQNQPIPPSQLDTVKKIVDESINFGRQLVVEFGAENVLMGIQQMGQTNRVRKVMKEVVDALNAGALSDAIYECRQIPDVEMDGTFLSHARLLGFINKCEAFMGEPLSTEF